MKPSLTLCRTECSLWSHSAYTWTLWCIKIMKSLLTILLILVFKVSGYTQNGELRGTVYDTMENEYVYDAEILLLNTSLGAYSDEQGKFLIRDIRDGIYDIRINYFDYMETVLQGIYVKGDTITQLEISLPGPCEFDKGVVACPICEKSDMVIPIIYGLPGSKLIRQADRGKVRLGGCILTACDPNSYCKRDNTEF